MCYTVVYQPCVHTPRYGVGYHMTLVKEQLCDSAQVTDMVQSIVRGAEQVTDVGAELSFVLPSSATPQFPELFETLEGTYVLRNLRICTISRSHNLHAQSTNFHLASPPESELLLWMCSSQDGRQP